MTDIYDHPEDVKVPAPGALPAEPTDEPVVIEDEPDSPEGDQP